jgi:hypothetical protein
MAVMEGEGETGEVAKIEGQDEENNGEETKMNQ